MAIYALSEEINAVESLVFDDLRRGYVGIRSTTPELEAKLKIALHENLVHCDELGVAHKRLLLEYPDDD